MKTADTEFQEYMAARWPVLVRTAYLLTGDQHQAEDVAQAALTRVYASWHKVRKADDVDAYVRRVLINVNTGRFRKRRVPEHLTAFRQMRKGLIRMPRPISVRCYWPRSRTCRRGSGP